MSRVLALLLAACGGQTFTTPAAPPDASPTVDDASASASPTPDGAEDAPAPPDARPVKYPSGPIPGPPDGATCATVQPCGSIADGACSNGIPPLAVPAFDCTCAGLAADPQTWCGPGNAGAPWSCVEGGPAVLVCCGAGCCTGGCLP
jgi:hypothetical protein